MGNLPKVFEYDCLEKSNQRNGGGVAGGSWVCRKAVGAGSSEAAFEHRLVGGEEERHFHI